VAGVELYNNTALQHKANDEIDDVTTCRIFEKSFRKRGVWRKNCGWSDLNNNTALQHKANDEMMTSPPVEFSKNLFENEEYGETVAGVISTTKQRRDTNGEEKTTEKTTTGESLEPS
jgi:hypothetical protein